MSASQDDENYWPGYVDALTTMTMVLTFIMLVLGLAVFTLSQNISKGMLGTIAAAVKVSQDTSPDLSNEDIAKRVIERIEQQQAELEQAQASVATLKSAQDLPSSVPGTGFIPPTGAGVLAQDTVVQSQSSAPDGQSAAPLTITAGKGVLRLLYRPRATGLDEAASGALTAALAVDGALNPAATLELVAGVDRSSLAISDANRVAYYRALIVRTRLIEAGMTPDRLKVRVDPSVGSNEVIISARH